MKDEYLYIKFPFDLLMGQCFDYEIDGKKYHLLSTNDFRKDDYGFAKILELPIEFRGADIPDIMRPCVNPETISINPKNIEAHIAKIYKRLEAITVEIRKRKLTE